MTISRTSYGFGKNGQAGLVDRVVQALRRDKGYHIAERVVFIEGSGEMLVMHYHTRSAHDEIRDATMILTNNRFCYNVSITGPDEAKSLIEKELGKIAALRKYPEVEYHD